VLRKKASDRLGRFSQEESDPQSEGHKIQRCDMKSNREEGVTNFRGTEVKTKRRKKMEGSVRRTFFKKGLS